MTIKTTVRLLQSPITHLTSDIINIHNEKKVKKPVETASKGDNVQTKSKPSSLKSDTNPFTIARERKAKNGSPLKVTFDERAVVHIVSRYGQRGHRERLTFYDADKSDKSDNSDKSCNHNKPKSTGSAVAKKKKNNNAKEIICLCGCNLYHFVNM
eukprot:UN04789